MMNVPKPIARWIRLNQWIAQQGWCSRREADNWIRQGWVRFEGEDGPVIPEIGTKINLNDATIANRITVADSAHEQVSRSVTIIFHKPLGVVSCQPDSSKNQTPAIQLLRFENQYIPCRQRRSHQWNNKQQNSDIHAFDRHRIEPYRLSKLAVAGRLDSNSTGLLLFTQSGRIAREIIGQTQMPSVNDEMGWKQAHRVEKEYLVRVKPINTSNILSPGEPLSYSLHKDPDSAERLNQLRRGILHDGDLLKAASVQILNDHQLQFILTEGKNHHIRRMCEAIQWRVVALKRVRIGSINLEDLPLGKWRYLFPHERDSILKTASGLISSTRMTSSPSSSLPD